MLTSHAVRHRWLEGVEPGLTSSLQPVSLRESIAYALRKVTSSVGSVVVPMLLGALLGRWIDGRRGAGSTWTIALLVLGLAVGCLNAWRAITKEQ